MAETQNRTIAVIDGNSLMHRAFHAIRQPMSAPDGRSTNALFGFFNMFIKLVDSFKPDGVICAFDKGKPQIRIDMLPQYKAQRPPMDESLHEQFPMVKELLRALDVPVVELSGWEGDDILGTLARRGEAAGYQMLLFTGDRDMYQLATDKVKIVSTKKGVTDVAIMTPESVDDLYHGITPELVPDFYGLKGDSSDNIPGVPGIGPKKAAALIVQYGNLDEVIAHADEVKGKMGENLRAHIDDALLSRKVATIRTDAPIELDLHDARFPTFDPAHVSEAFSALGFTGMISRLTRLGGAAVGAASTASTERAASTTRAASAASAASSPSATMSQAEAKNAENFSSNQKHSALEMPALLSQKEGEEQVSKALAKGEWIGAAFEDVTRSKGQATLFEMDRTAPLWIATSAGVCCFENGTALDVLVRIVHEGKLAAGDVKGLLHELYPLDSAKEALIQATDIDPKRIFDIGVAGYLLNSDAQSFSVSDLCLRVLGENLAVESATDKNELAASSGGEAVDKEQGGTGSKERVLTERALDAWGALHLVEPLRELMSKDVAQGVQGSTFDVFTNIEMPLLSVLMHMERTGLHTEASILDEQSRGIDAEINQMVSDIKEQAQVDFNIDSPQQLSHVLFDVWKLPTTGLKKTKKGFYSTNAKTLDELARGDERVRKILDYRERAKIKSTYLDALPADILQDGRIHTTLNQTVAATGRLSSSSPNLQNIPTRSELGHRVRTAFTVPEGSFFLACDYSQIELRLLAHLSADKHLVAAFNSGADFHAATAARVFDVPVEEVTPQLRSRAKAVNFGIVYGQQAFGLSTSLGIPRKEAQEMIDRYFEAYPGVRSFLDQSISFAREHGYATTMYGRKRHIKDIKSRNFQLRSFAERTAMNHPMQGSAADIIKIAMINVEKRLQEEGLKAKLVLQIHDELDFEVPADEVDALSELVRETMQGVCELRVPLLADVSVGKNWAEAK